MTHLHVPADGSWGADDLADITAIAAACGVLNDHQETPMTTARDLCPSCVHLREQHRAVGGCTCSGCGCAARRAPTLWQRLKAWLIEDSPTDPPLTRQQIADGAPTNIFAAAVHRIITDADQAVAR